jgi:hypothetical protein
MVSTNGVSDDEFYGSQWQKYKNDVKELYMISGVAQLGNGTVQTVQDVEVAKLCKVSLNCTQDRP